MPEERETVDSASLRRPGAKEPGTVPTIPDHKLLRPIGHGAYGDVWLARNAIGAYRAVKIVYRSNFEEVEPYEREFVGIKNFEPISRSSEGLVDILHVGRNDVEGYFYYVMELADNASGSREPEENLGGGDAQEPMAESNTPRAYSPKNLSIYRKERGRLPFEECVQLGLALSLALARLHRAGLIHRDVKPSNIIFVDGQAKLADLGLVAEVSEANSMVGTIGYVPPEGPNSTQSDLYSLGKVLYEISMGKDRKEFPIPSADILKEEESNALLELNAVVLKACARTPSERYQSAEELHADLALLQSGRSLRRKRSIERRLSSATRLGKLAAVVAALATAAYFFQQDQTRQVRELMNQQAGLRQAAQNQARRAEDSERQSQERLVRMHVATGERLMEEGDLLGALPWFVEALKSEKGLADRETMHRVRIASVLRQAPKLVHMWFHDAQGANGQFSPSGREILSFEEADRVVHLVDLKTKGRLGRPLVHPGSVTGATFSSDGRWLMTTCADNSARLWNLNTFQLAGPLMKQADALNAASLSPNAQRVVTAGGDGKAIIWDLTLQTPVVNLPHPGSILCADFSPDNRWIISGCEDGKARLWDAETGRMRPQTIASKGGLPVRAASFSPDNQHILIVSGDQAAVFDQTPNGPELKHDLGGGWWVFGAVFSPDSRRVLTWDRGAKAEIWETGSGQLSLPPLEHPHGVQSAEFSADGRFILTVSRDQSVRIWHATSGQLACSPLRKLGPISHLTARLSPDRRRLLLCQAGHTRLYDLVTSELAGPLILGAGIKRVGFIGDEQSLLTINTDNAAQVWDPVSGHEVFPAEKDFKLPLPFEANLAPYNSSLLPESVRTQSAVTSGEKDRELLVEENTAVLAEAKTHQAVATLLKHRERISWGAFSPDGSEIVTCSFDASARVWDARTGMSLTPPLRHSFEVGHAVFSREGHWLATLSRSEDAVKVWNLTPDSRPVEDLAALSQLLTGTQINEMGSQLEIRQPSLIEALWQKLQGPHPQDDSTRRTDETAALVQESLESLRRSDRSSVFLGIAPEKDPSLWIWRSRLNKLMSRWPDAVEDISQAIQLEPRRSELWHDRGHCQMKLERWSEAQADFDKAVAIEPGNAVSWNRRGHCLTRLQRPAEAGESFSRAIELRPASPGFWQDRGRWHAGAGCMSAALADFSRAQELISGHTTPSTIPHQPSPIPPLSALLPNRDARAQSSHLDLSRFYNMTAIPPGPVSPWPSLRLTYMLPGFKKYAGIDFDARGIIALSSPEVLYQCGSFPEQVLGIPVQTPCRSIHFLHSAIFTEAAGGEIGKFIIYFPDGTRSELPLRFDINTGAYWLRSTITGTDTVAISLHGEKQDDPQTLFVTRWNNPRPGVPVVMIDFITSNRHAAPFLLAISTEN